MTHVTNNLTPIKLASLASLASLLQPQTLFSLFFDLCSKNFYICAKEKERRRYIYLVLSSSVYNYLFSFSADNVLEHFSILSISFSVSSPSANKSLAQCSQSVRSSFRL